MLSSRRSGLFALLIAVYALSAEVLAGQCAAVDCDCDAFTEERWRADCKVQEHKIYSECMAGAGKLKSYCGLHGPLAYPLATSIQSVQPLLETSESSKSLLKQVETQTWSKGETYKAFLQAVNRREYGQAIQLASLVEKDTERLFTLQKRAVAALIAEGEARDARDFAMQYATINADSAETFTQFSEQLWLDIGIAGSDKERRAYKILSFKTARTAAAVREFSADLYGMGDSPENAAAMWQQAASMAQKLLLWESQTGNDSQHIRYYQAQASARWHRATFYWLQANRLEQGEKTNKYARVHLSPKVLNDSLAGVDGDDLHSIDQEDMRTIKRK